MSDNNTRSRFSIFFDKTDPSHFQVAEILSRQGYRGKAQYLVNAVLHYEGHTEMPGAKRPARFDEKVIEAVVNRILKNREIPIAGQHPAKPIDTYADMNEGTAHIPLVEDITFDDALDELGEDGLNAVLGALDMFRKG